MTFDHVLPLRTWLYHLARGFDDEPVTARQLPKSIGCNKMFNGPEALVDKNKVDFDVHAYIYIDSATTIHAHHKLIIKTMKLTINI